MQAGQARRGSRTDRSAARRKAATGFVAAVLALAGTFSAQLPAVAADAWYPISPSTFDVWTQPTTDVNDLTIIVAYSFGNRQPAGTDPSRTPALPGPVNEALADTVARTRGTRNIPVYAQWEIADVLRSKYGMSDVISIDYEINPDGTIKYLSTDDVAAKVQALRGAQAATDVAGIVAFKDHLWRATRTTADHCFRAYAPEDVAMPDQYDPQSGQLWTTSPALYQPVDTAGRAALLVKEQTSPAHC